MDELIAKIKEKAGITAEQATLAAESVKEFLKTKLPEPLNGYVEQFFSNTASGLEHLSDLPNKLGELFGKK